MPLKNSGKDVFSISWISSKLNQLAVSGILIGSTLGAKFCVLFFLGNVSWGCSIVIFCKTVGVLGDSEFFGSGGDFYFVTSLM